jgi:hypothetical protein
MLAFAALECAYVKTFRPGRNPSQAHAGLALGTVRALDGRKRGPRVEKRFRHIMHPCWIRREHNSATGNCQGRCGDSWSVTDHMFGSRHKFGFRCWNPTRPRCSPAPIELAGMGFGVQPEEVSRYRVSNRQRHRVIFKQPIVPLANPLRLPLARDVVGGAFGIGQRGIVKAFGVFG